MFFFSIAENRLKNFSRFLLFLFLVMQIFIVARPRTWLFSPTQVKLYFPWINWVQNNILIKRLFPRKLWHLTSISMILTILINLLIFQTKFLVLDWNEFIFIIDCLNEMNHLTIIFFYRLQNRIQLIVLNLFENTFICKLTLVNYIQWKKISPRT